ncbi:Transcriptional factor [Mycena indigotica]|uniref:Transcriptional factor n=1 Tax=Mycena indigotica TaxID=2126181 RepID=A0A8H6WCI2_9AGAR|nr:Transcriptional factor [Mycena indigotica]KAF7309783.1 Transcriptional factor [Mycena indigotica]
MQSTSNSVKIYNAVYSSVQVCPISSLPTNPFVDMLLFEVYECMVRNIAVMRRRADSFVNATQILKVAGVDKGRRTKILEKEILPGKHEIVQGGYGKYQGTWIPLERGRDIAQQYGVGPLLAPLFDFIPSTSSLGPLPLSAPIGAPSPRPLSAASSYGTLPGSQGHYPAAIQPGLAPPPIMPGSALRLLNQGRAQGLFTPSTSHAQPGYASPSYGPATAFSPTASQTPPPTNALKRNRSDATDIDVGPTETDTRPPSTTPRSNGETAPSPAKRARTETVPPPIQPSSTLPAIAPTVTNGISRPASPKSTNGADVPPYPTRLSTKPSIPKFIDPTAPIRDPRRTAVIAAICQNDDPHAVQDVLRELTPEAAVAPSTENPLPYEVDTILDDQGHTALHIAASLAHLRTVNSLIVAGGDIQRGNHLGETPLMRACLATHSFDSQTFDSLVTALSASIRTLDTSRKSVLHHVAALAGVKGRGAMARYYLDKIFYFIVQNQAGDFATLVDLQDEHGDTALNIAARVGNRSMVRTFLDVGANRHLPNKLGLRPADFGVEIEQDGTRSEDRLAALRSGPPPPVQKSQDVIADMTVMIQGLSNDFQAEIKLKQDALDVTQAHLRAATRELSEQRKQIQAWQARCGELDQVQQRIRNIEKALLEEDEFDWTGRSNGSGEPDAEGEVEDESSDAIVGAENNGGPAFRWRPTMGTGELPHMASNLEAEPPIPVVDSLESLVQLRRLKLWHARMEDLTKARLKGLQGASAEKEYQCKKIVALSTQQPIDKIEDLLETLLIAVESESQVVDLSRVSGFMQKVRDGII